MEGVAAFAVDGHLFFDVRVVVVFEGDFAGDLDGVELAGVDVAFDLAECGDDGGIAGGPADAPAGHVEALGEGVEFDGDIHGAGDFQDAARGFFEVDFAIRQIIGNHPVVFLREGDGFFVEGARGGGRGGVVRIVQPDKFGFAFDLLGDGVEVGEEIIFLQQRHDVGDAAGEEGAGVVDGVAGLRDEHDIAGVDDGEGEVGDAVF